MTLREHIEDVRTGLREGRFPNESAISQGVVLRLLAALGWPTFDTRVVWPEFATEGNRADFALCHPAGKPLLFVEVKQTGKGDGADEQLFRYLLRGGIPMAVMTDGREWHFYLPGGQGSYQDRRIYLLDLLDRPADESAARLTRYLAYDDARTQRTIEAAWSDYRDASTAREVERHLPEAWAELLDEAAPALVALLAEKVVERLGGFTPAPERVATFLRAQRKAGPTSALATNSRPKTLAPSPPQAAPPQAAASKPVPIETGFTLLGTFHPAKSASSAYREVFRSLIARDAGFADHFAARAHGKKRRFLSRSKEELFPGRKDLQEGCAFAMPEGWWLGGNVSRASIVERLRLACEVAGLVYGTDLVLHG